jgi:hypothetical protein
MNKTWRCPLLWTFFGLDDKYIKNVYDQIFVLKYHGGWSFTEAYNLPVMIRLWFIDRLTKQFEMERDAAERAKSSR